MSTKEPMSTGSKITLFIYLIFQIPPSKQPTELGNTRALLAGHKLYKAFKMHRQRHPISTPKFDKAYRTLLGFKWQVCRLSRWFFSSLQLHFIKILWLPNFPRACISTGVLIILQLWAMVKTWTSCWIRAQVKFISLSSIKILYGNCLDFDFFFFKSSSFCKKENHFS